MVIKFALMNGFFLNVVSLDLSSAVLYIDTYHVITFILFAIAIQADGVIILLLLLVDHTDLHVYPLIM